MKPHILKILVLTCLLFLSALIPAAAQTPEEDKLMKQGEDFERAGRYEAAIDVYSKVIAIRPDHLFAYFQRGETYCKKNDFSRAAADFTKAIEIQPDSLFVYEVRGYAYYMMRDYDGAISDLSKALQTNPYIKPVLQGKMRLMLSDAYNQRGKKWFQARDVARAIADYNKAIEYAPQSGDGYFLRALAYWRSEPEKSKLDLEKAVSLGFKPPPDFVKELNKKLEEKGIGRFAGPVADASSKNNPRGWNLSVTNVTIMLLLTVIGICLVLFFRTQR
jgi:tetratricopeptide (TPR) repeat protein